MKFTCQVDIYGRCCISFGRAYSYSGVFFFFCVGIYLALSSVVVERVALKSAREGYLWSGRDQAWSGGVREHGTMYRCFCVCVFAVEFTPALFTWFYCVGSRPVHQTWLQGPCHAAKRRSARVILDATGRDVTFCLYPDGTTNHEMCKNETENSQIWLRTRVS